MKFFKASNDSMFKSIFANEKNRDLLEGIIEGVINKKVKVTKLMPTEQIKNNVNVKGKTLDVLAKVGKDEINIEVNTSVYSGLHNRNAAYIFKRYSEGLMTGESYNEMPQYIQINLTKAEGEEIPLITEYYLEDKEQRKYINNLTIYEINIEKAKKEWYNTEDGRKIIALLDCDKKELDSIKGDGLVEKFKKEVKKLNQDEDFVQFLTKEDEERLLINTLKNNSYEEGVNEGIEQGFAKGVSEGINQGFNEGIITTAKNMLKEGLTIEFVSKVTGLSIEEIENL